MAFIHTIDPADAQGTVRDMYDKVRQSYGYVPNWMRTFSLRPAVQDGWVALLSSIRASLSVRTYELATLAAARALRNSYCALAHGSVLAAKVFDPAAVTAIALDAPDAPTEPRERAMMAFAEKVALSADRVSAADVEILRSHGYRDEEIFDIAATAAARCFFSKLMDALGTEPDAAFHDLDPAMRRALTVGRPVAERSA